MLKVFFFRIYFITQIATKHLKPDEVIRQKEDSLMCRYRQVSESFLTFGVVDVEIHKVSCGHQDLT